MTRGIYRTISLFMSIVLMIYGCSTYIIAANAKTDTGSLNTYDGKYPVKWDLTKIYASKKEWNADYDKAMKLIDKYEDYKGTLNTAENIYNYFKFAYMSELTELEKKLLGYVSLGMILDSTDSYYSELNSQIDSLFLKEKQMSVFAEPEIFSLSLEQRKKIFSDPIFENMDQFLKKYSDPEYVFLDEKEGNILATVSAITGYGNTLYNILMGTEIPYPMITMPDGTETELTDQLYDDIVESSEYDDDFKVYANELMSSRLDGYKNTLITLLEENCTETYVNAQLNKYDTTLEYELSLDDLDKKLYDQLLESANKGIPELQRYYNVHKKALGLKDQYSFHLSKNVSDFNPGKTDYDTAVDEVRESLSVLGEDYIAAFDKIVKGGQVDVYPAKNKVAGNAFKCDIDKMPYVYFNYNGSFEDVRTVAHEMGHAVYDAYSNKYQSEINANPSTFTHEVASTVNELIFCTYKINNAKNDDEKLYYLENLLNMYSTYFFTTMWMAELEDYMYKQVESGAGLNADAVGEKYIELLKKYRGDSVVANTKHPYGFMDYSHFFDDPYYFYQYAADVSYASSIAQRISNKEKGAAEEYIEFLKLGGSKEPATLLSKAGIDPHSEKTYEYALNYYKGLVDEYEILTNKLKN